MRRLLIRLSGAHPEILSRFPAERLKYTGIASAILAMGVLACASMFFALHNALRIGVFAAIASAVVWGLVIMSMTAR